MAASTLNHIIFSAEGSPRDPKINIEFPDADSAKNFAGAFNQYARFVNPNFPALVHKGKIVSFINLNRLGATISREFLGINFGNESLCKFFQSLTNITNTNFLDTKTVSLRKRTPESVTFKKEALSLVTEDNIITDMVSFKNILDENFALYIKSLQENPPSEEQSTVLNPIRKNLEELLKIAQQYYPNEFKSFCIEKLKSDYPKNKNFTQEDLPIFNLLKSAISEKITEEREIIKGLKGSSPLSINTTSTGKQRATLLLSTQASQKSSSDQFMPKKPAVNEDFFKRKDEQVLNNYLEICKRREDSSFKRTAPERYLQIHFIRDGSEKIKAQYPNDAKKRNELLYALYKSVADEIKSPSSKLLKILKAEMKFLADENSYVLNTKVQEDFNQFLAEVYAPKLETGRLQDLIAINLIRKSEEGPELSKDHFKYEAEKVGLPDPLNLNPKKPGYGIDYPRYEDYKNYVKKNKLGETLGEADAPTPLE